MRDSRRFTEMRERLFIASRAAFGHSVLNSVMFFSGFAVIPAVNSANKVASYPAYAFKLHSLAYRLRICHGIYLSVCLS